MEKGSLFCVLTNGTEAIELDWIERVNLIKSIADALSYLHHDCDPNYTRDVSSNNILLTSKLEATLANFGNARILELDSSNQTILVGTHGHIAPDLIYAKNGITRSIPPQIGAFSKLTYLNLAHNELPGELPLSLANLTELVEFNISDNDFSGYFIFPILENLKILIALHLSQWIFWYHLSSSWLLATVNLNHNRLRGTIPSAFCHSTNLSHLDISSNVQIDGLLPADIGNLKSLVEFDFSYNNLSGPISLAIGGLTKLEYLVGASNQIDSSRNRELERFENS
ncbi:hypothetical protein ACH5RR_007293 [Cinchona calisaya]|uniref:Protein kinase domain-containing protein n=1 Tax=Cinchona calisaya TaxID=153742 RepID=A0ABD3ARV8_9GENT